LFYLNIEIYQRPLMLLVVARSLSSISPGLLPVPRYLAL